MAVRVGKGIYDDHVSLELSPGNWTDTFILKIAHDRMLPPWDYAEAIKTAIRPLVTGRRGASLWLPIESPGRWFRQEFEYALGDLGFPVAVTDGMDKQPIFRDFLSPPVTYRTKCHGGVPDEHPVASKLTDHAARALLTMTRLVVAYTGEVASACLTSEPTSRESLWELEKLGYVEYYSDNMQIDDHLAKVRRRSDRFNPRPNDSPRPYWKIRRSGVSAALRLWGVPPLEKFTYRNERNRLADGDHRRKSRQWPIWVKKALPHADIYAGWSEVGIPRIRAYPDGLAWGKINGVETLFWMEVETGKTSREYLVDKLSLRWRKAIRYASRIAKVRLVFTFLGMPWVRESARMVFCDIPKDSAVIVSDWRDFGQLPYPKWGELVF